MTMNLAFPAQANTAALNQTAAGNNASGLMAGLLAFFSKYVRPMQDGAELNFISADDVVAQDAAQAPGLFARLTESADSRRRRLDTAYLSEATDLYDLEYRSREIDRRNHRNGGW
jgi:hypothetical protein